MVLNYINSNKNELFDNAKITLSLMQQSADGII